MSREVHVRFCESLRGRFPWATRLVVGFQHRAEAERFRTELQERLRKFNLELHADKTRLIEFGCFAAGNIRARGEGKPDSFDFLGFTHICGKTRKGKFAVLRQTMRKKMQGKLREVKQELRRRMHRPSRKWDNGCVPCCWDIINITECRATDANPARSDITCSATGCGRYGDAVSASERTGRA